MSENTPPAAAAPPPHEGRETDPASGAMHEELLALEAARRIVDDEAAKDQPVGPPLPDTEFDPVQAVAAATDSAMRDAQGNIINDAFRDVSRMANEVVNRKGGPIDRARQESMARRREELKWRRASGAMGIGPAFRRGTFGSLGRKPATPGQPPADKAPEAPDQTDSEE